IYRCLDPVITRTLFTSLRDGSGETWLRQSVWRLHALFLGNQPSVRADIAYRITITLSYGVTAVILIWYLTSAMHDGRVPFIWQQPAFAVGSSAALYFSLATFVSLRMLRGYLRIRAAWGKVRVTPCVPMGAHYPTTIRVAHLTDLHVTADE